MTPPPSLLSAPGHDVAARPRYLCHCLKVTHDQVEACVNLGGCENVTDVTASCGAGGGCTACHRKIRAMLGNG